MHTLQKLLATANKIIIRDASGRAQVASPSADSDIATKKYVDDIASGDAGAVQQALNTHIAKTTGVHGATSEATANKIAIRDASGRMKVKDPSDDLDAANKQTVVSLINSLAVQSWTAISDTKFSGTEINAITYGNSRFVAVGSSGKASRSIDAETWVAISDMKFSSTVINAIAYGNGKFVAVGSSGKYSTDGINWTAISDTKFSDTAINAITYGNGKFVAVGGSTFPARAKGAYSPDGVNWTAISDMKFSSTVINAIAYGNGKFVAVGNNGKGAYSTDGINWTAISDTKIDGANINAITYSNGIFVAVGNFGRGVYSTNGVTWLAIKNRANLATANAITYGQDKLIIGFKDGTVAYSLNLVS